MENQPYYNFTTTLLPDNKLKNIFDRLDALQVGAIVKVNDPDNIPFIKQYIDCYKTAEFNSDYTKLKKIENYGKENT